MTDMALVKYNAVKENSKQIARKMLAKGVPVEAISEFTNLTIAEINAL